MTGGEFEGEKNGELGTGWKGRGKYVKRMEKVEERVDSRDVQGWRCGWGLK